MANAALAIDTISSVYEGFEDVIVPIESFVDSGKRVIWAPQKGPQLAFLRCPFFEVLYGGAAGGGKTESLLIDFLTDVNEWGRYWRGILFRQSYPQLEEVINRSLELYPQIFPGAKYSVQAKSWHFPNGANLKFRSLDRPQMCTAYHGHQYTWIGFDELTHWKSDHEYEFMKSRCRSPVKGIPKRVRASANPGFVGTQWVKSYFIDHGPYVPVTNEQGLVRTYIPARLDDNVILDRNDPTYRKQLESIRDAVFREAMLSGNWDITAGTFFGDVFRRDIHVVSPFIPPKTWYCDRSLDWGSSRPFACLYWGMSNGEQLPDGRIFPYGALVLFYEIYGIKTSLNGEIEHNTGVRWSSTKIAQKMKAVEAYWKSRAGTLVYPGPADLDIFIKEDGHCIYDGFLEEGIAWEKANKGTGSRIQGWQLLRERLWPENSDYPMIFITSNCVNWLRTVPSLVRDERNWEDVDTDQEDHAGDATRYRLLAPEPYVPSGQAYWK